MEKFIERLDQFMQNEGINDNQMTVNAGLSVGLIGKCRKNNRGMASDSIEKILHAYPELSAEWLLTGDGEMYKEDGGWEVKNIPMLSMEAFAGPGAPNYNDISFTETYVVKEFNDSDFLIRVKGDSMSPKFTGGDIVACKKVESLLFFQWGRVYVLYTQSQGVMIKRIQPSEREDCIKCVSDNEKYAPFDVPKEDIVALALVNGSISRE